MTSIKEYSINIWSIITGQDFRELFFVEDATLPAIPNPDFDNTCISSPSNRETIFPPKDLTGWTGKMDIREGADRTSALLVSLETPSVGITIGQPDPIDGSVELFIDNTITNAVNFLNFAGNDAYFDLFLFPPVATTDNKRLFKGRIPIIGTTTDV